ncbi:E3 ubiquitin-protein ligase SHPRH-like [Watersipora subatra]|uniref:E3 ubiquitin-protein ligase SHPRH-like n=1 Tax=Watersipora subatra TaxID=2589382 RepID=UPI00355B1E7C
MNIGLTREQALQILTKVGVRTTPSGIYVGPVERTEGKKCIGLEPNMPSKRKRKSTQPVKRIPYAITGLKEGACGEPLQHADSSTSMLSSELKALLDQAAFYIHLRDSAKSKKSESCILLGEFVVTVDESRRTKLPEAEDLWLYVANHVQGHHFLYAESTDRLKEPQHFEIKLPAPSFGHLLSSLAIGVAEIGRNCVQLTFSTKEDGLSASVQVLVDSRYIYDLSASTSYSKMQSKWIHSLKAALALTGHTPLPTDFTIKIEKPSLPPTPSFRHDVAALFRMVKLKDYLREEINPDLNTDPAMTSYGDDKGMMKHLLLKKLRPYQMEALKWMISMEKELYTSAYGKSIRKLFTALPRNNLYMNSDSGVLIPQLPELTLFPGGILADEMGLGKTLEVLACMVCHPSEAVMDIAPLPSTAYTVGSSLTSESPGLAAVSNKDGLRSHCRFECTCGLDNTRNVKVQCCVCSLQQHADCVGYDLQDMYRGPYKCPHCHAISTPIKSGATLIIAPFSIKHQWREEIIKHIGGSHCQILEYEGVTSKKYVQPMVLARQDIVITTYDVLKAELRSTHVPHSNSHTGRLFRQPKRFMALPSPLIAVEWWRVCLDEAQMVESVTTSTAEMALKLSAVNRWCVTGTPINSGVNDLYGLLLFLGVPPFATKTVWDALIYRPYCFGLPNNLYSILQHVMWRTCKADVREQLGLPPLTEVLHEVTFVPVEEVFYRQKYSVCRRRCLQIINKFSNKEARLDSLSRYTLSEILQSLTSMRQACCYPEVSRERRRAVHAPRMTLTMDELLKHLLQEVKVQTDDAYRCIVAALNGQAGCHAIWGQHDKAIEKYWEVLHPSQPQYSAIEPDTLQCIHASHNLRELLKVSHHKSLKINIEVLDQEIEQFVRTYMRKSNMAVESACSEHQAVDAKVCEKPIMATMSANSEGQIMWWVALHENIIDSLPLTSGAGADVLQHVQNGVYQSQNTAQITSIRNIDGLMYKLYNDWVKLANSYTETRDVVLRLSGLHTEVDAVSAVVSCCLRPDNQRAEKCPLCQAEDVLKRHEFTLYDYRQTYLTEGEEQRTGNWTDSVMELAFKALISYMKQALANRSILTYELTDACIAGLQDYLKQAADHMALLDSMKRQFKSLRAFWSHMRNRFAAMDEMEMAKTRFRLRYPWETVESKSVEVLEEYEVEEHYQKQLNDMAAGQADFAAAERQHNYLKHISSLPIDERLGNTEQCPICKSTLGHTWVVLSCCHCFCIDCTQVLTSHRTTIGLALGARQAMRCAVCRRETRQHHISYVSSGKVTNSSDEAIHVEGNYSSKVTEVIKCLKVIAREEPNAKALVFSTWTSLLEVVARALTENDITYQYLGGKYGRGYEEKLNDFRCNTGIEALLLPIASGANGLNLTDASHVLLLEPLLHAGREAQAIGRIHRIGQTKPTYVHRFLVKHTIEEQIHSITSTIPSAASIDTLAEEMPFTLADLATMFDPL